MGTNPSVLLLVEAGMMKAFLFTWLPWYTSFNCFEDVFFFVEAAGRLFLGTKNILHLLR